MLFKRFKTGPGVLLIVLLAVASQSLAATLCVSTPAVLIQAINAFDDQPDDSTLTIKLVQGTYNVGNALGASRHLAFPNSVGLKILGGYTANCASRQINPSNTVLDGGNQAGGGLGVTLDDEAVLLIEGLTFRHFSAASNAAVLDIGLDRGTDDEAVYELRQNRFIDNSAGSIININGPQVRLINNLVAGNTLAGGNSSAVQLTYEYEADTGLVVNNNTIASNTGGKGLTIDSDDEQSNRLSEFADNIVWGNSGVDLDLTAFAAPNQILFSYNVIGSVVGMTLPADTLASNPQFVDPAARNFGLLSGSPAVNSGAPVQLNGFPVRDLNGGTRVIGSRIDRGAVESGFNDATGFVVTTFGDNGNNSSPLAGSLRAGIKAANAASGPFRISFQVAGNCPNTLVLATPMLDITGDVTIDGSSQAGWVENSQYGVFDATLCLFVNGGGNTPWAFHVPASAGNARLLVRGMIFAGFTDAAIKLEGGRGHLITGNQFGAVGFTLPSQHAIRVTGNAGTTQIGGFDDTGSVNLIAGTSVAAVYLDNPAGGAVLGNNLIGFQPDGQGSGANPVGVFIFNSPNNTLFYNYIGNSGGNGVTISGAQSAGNVLQYNVIGRTNIGQPAGNAGAGIAVNVGARNTAIGGPLSGSFGANRIESSGGPGVWITPTGGSGNRVVAGIFAANAGLDIDLGSAGATANQTNPGSGPNNVQNFPVLTQATRSSHTNFVSGTLSSTPSTRFRIDLYYGLLCGPAGRGTALLALGSFLVDTNAAGQVSFNGSAPSATTVTLGRISATATDPAGNTSEIGNCVTEVSGSAPDALFKNGFE